MTGPLGHVCITRLGLCVSGSVIVVILGGVAGALTILRRIEACGECINMCVLYINERSKEDLSLSGRFE